MKVARLSTALAGAAALIGLGFYFGWRSAALMFIWPSVPLRIADDYHMLFYYNASQTWENTFWLGVPTQKLPLDLWVYQEILWELKPDLVIEAGTYKGGSALFFASIMDLIGKGRVVTIDLQHPEALPQHDRITYLLGSSISEEIISEVRQLAKGAETVMVVLDSDHSTAHVFEEIRHYHDLVTPGSYLIVEDTNLAGHPVRPDFPSGPMEAVEAFLEQTDTFVADRSREKYFVSLNPKGYLRRLR